MPKRESLYAKYPDYRVALEPNPTRVHVTFDGETVVDSERTVIVRETKHDPVIYFPRDDVNMSLLERTEHETFCPFKGEASYWTLRHGDAVEENAVWTYEDPYEQVDGLRDYVAFYGDKVEWKEGGLS